MDEISILNLFLEAGLVVKIVMLLLFIASILSWIIIVERYNFFKRIKNINDGFLKKFWSGEDLNNLYKEISSYESLYGAMNLFKNSYEEFKNIDSDKDISELDLESINRSMRVSIASDVAPGISEALIATGMGLFAAIPAVIAFNKFTSESETISQSTLIFAEELASIFYKQSINK